MFGTVHLAVKGEFLSFSGSFANLIYTFSSLFCLNIFVLFYAKQIIFGNRQRFLTETDIPAFFENS